MELWREKKNYMVEVGLSMMLKVGVPMKYWKYSFKTLFHLTNRLPCRILGNKSSHEFLFHYVPSYDHFKLFGFLCFLYLKFYNSHKLESRSLSCTFLGYMV